MPENTIQEALSPLGERLWDFESKKYLRQTGSYFGGVYFDFRKLMFEIGKSLQVFPSNDIYNVLNVYEKRINQILSSLELNSYEIIYDVDEVTTELIREESVLLDSKGQKQMMEKWKEELQYYLEELKKIKQLNLINMEENPRQINETVQVINLPENFTVRQLNKTFTPQLTVNEATLFLYYLRQLKILPPYSDVGLGKLAEAFFVRNQKRITKGITQINTLKQNERGELVTLKNVLETIVQQIDSDLEKPAI